MKSQIKYLLLLVLGMYLALVGHASLGSDRVATGASNTARYAFGDAAGGQHDMPASWIGTARLASVLNADLDSRLQFSDAGDGLSKIAYRVGPAARGDGPATTQTTQLAWAGGVTRVTWSDGQNGYTFAHNDGEDTADLYVSRNRVRYLVPLFSEARVAAGAMASTGSIFATAAREGLALMAPRFLALLVLYFIVAGAFYLGFWRLFKNKLAHRKVQPGWPKKGRIRAEMGHSLIVIVTMTLFSFGTVFVIESGHSKIYRNVSDYGWPYWFFSLAAIFVLMDAFTYWTHRLMHHRKLFLYVHAIHHKSYHPSPWTTLSMSINEIIINAVFMPAVLMMMPVHQHIAIAFTLLTLFKNVFNHLGFEVFPAWMNSWLVGATFHETHHMRVNGNYSSYFTWWDRWMKTEHTAETTRRVTSARRDEPASTGAVAAPHIARSADGEV